MAEAIWITLLLILVTIAGILAFLYFVQITQTAENQKKTPSFSHTCTPFGIVVTIDEQ